MIARIIIVGLLVFSLIAGAALYYLQVYAYYDEVQAIGDDVQVTSLVSNAPETIIFDDFRAIDAISSPLRYRACFTTPQSNAMMTETYMTLDDAVPTIAPSWFDCFDAKELGELLEAGAATAYLGTENILYGVDRIVAVSDDGRGFVWHQINECGEVVFDGKPVPEHCPAPPEGSE